MPPSEMVAYLSSLLNRQVMPADTVNLSSAHRARFMGWLESNGVSTDSTSVPATFEVHTLAERFGAAPAAGVIHQSGTRSRSTPAAPPVRGIGIDVQSVSELVKSDSLHDLKGDPELRAIFTMRELSLAEGRGSPAETLAGIFAAKEAIRKADPAMMPQPLTEIEILPDESGAPQFAGYAISISHSAGIAVAIAMANAPERHAPLAAASADVPSSAPSAVAPIASAMATGALPRRARRLGMLVVVLLIGVGAAGIAWLRSLAH